MRKGTGVERTRRGLARAACLLVTLAVLVLSSASAQTVIPTPSTPDFKLFKPLFTEAEVLAGLSGTASKAVRWGRVLPVVGAISLASTAIFAGLDWYYQQAQQATGTPLDNWYQGLAEGTPGVETPLVNCGSSGVYCRPANEAEQRAWSGSSGIGGPGSGTPCGYSSGCVVVGSWVSASGTVSSWIGGGGSYSRVSGYSHSATPGCSTGETCRAALLPLMQQSWTEFAAAMAASGGGVGTLADHLAANPSSRAALAGEVLPGWMRDREDQSWWPYTYAEPYGSGAGIEFDPAPNINEWYDNPYANPQVDSDGDGWPDWQEVEAGTDPKNPNSYPTVTPDPYQDSDGDGWSDHEERQAGTDPYDDQDYPAGTPDPQPKPDVDGDGIPDELDPCPFDALNRCVDGNELPDDIATESTLQGVLAAAERIADNTADPGGSPDVEALPGIGPDYDAWTPFPNTSTVWATAQGQVAADVAALQSTLSGKIPFGFASWFPSAPAVGSASFCSSFEVEIASVETSVNICDNPLDAFMAGTGRSLLLALAYLSFILTVIRRVQQA